MGLEAIGDGIKVNLDTISGLRVFAPKELPESINEFPAVLILPGETAYTTTFAGSCDYVFRLILLISKADQPSALNKILDYIEPTGTYSILAAIDADTTLNGSAATCILYRNLGIGSTRWGGRDYLSTEFELSVWT